MARKSGFNKASGWLGDSVLVIYPAFDLVGKDTAEYYVLRRAVPSTNLVECPVFSYAEAGVVLNRSNTQAFMLWFNTVMQGRSNIRAVVLCGLFPSYNSVAAGRLLGGVWTPYSYTHPKSLEFFIRRYADINSGVPYFWDTAISSSSTMKVSMFALPTDPDIADLAATAAYESNRNIFTGRGLYGTHPNPPDVKYAKDVGFHEKLNAATPVHNNWLAVFRLEQGNYSNVRCKAAIDDAIFAETTAPAGNIYFADEQIGGNQGNGAGHFASVFDSYYINASVPSLGKAHKRLQAKSDGSTANGFYKVPPEGNGILSKAGVPAIGAVPAFVPCATNTKFYACFNGDATYYGLGARPVKQNDYKLSKGSVFANSRSNGAEPNPQVVAPQTGVNISATDTAANNICWINNVTAMQANRLVMESASGFTYAGSAHLWYGQQITINYRNIHGSIKTGYHLTVLCNVAIDIPATITIASGIITLTRNGSTDHTVNTVGMTVEAVYDDLRAFADSSGGNWSLYLATGAVESKAYSAFRSGATIAIGCCAEPYAYGGRLETISAFAAYFGGGRCAAEVQLLTMANQSTSMQRQHDLGAQIWYGDPLARIKV